MTGAGSTFQVDLRGVVDLLRTTCTPAPGSTCASCCRTPWTPSPRGARGRSPAPPRRSGSCRPTSPATAACTSHDTGIGLDEAHPRAARHHRRVSKRDELGFARAEFLGQFGIGLLSCFLVADEIRVHHPPRRQRRDLCCGSAATTARMPCHAPPNRARARHRRRDPPARQRRRPAVRRRRRAVGHVVRRAPAARPRRRDRGRPGDGRREGVSVGGGRGRGPPGRHDPLVRARARLHPARRRRPVRPRSRRARTGLRAPALLGCPRHAPPLREADAGGRLGARRAARVGVLRAGRARRRRAGARRPRARRCTTTRPCTRPGRVSASSSSAGC